MDDKDWRILKMIAEEKNITRAAARLFISQPALTYRLKNIEEEFGVQIVTRVPSGVVFTPQGDHLLSYASAMLFQYDVTKEQLRNMTGKVEGALRMGSSGVFAQYNLPKILKGFLALYPDVDISVKAGLSHEILPMLASQEIAIAIVRGEHEWEGERFLLAEEPICLVSRDRIELNDLLASPQIRYDADPSLNKMIDDWWRKNYSTPAHTTMELGAVNTARQMVLHGLGWAILPSIGMPTNDRLYSIALTWPDGRPLIRNTWVFCSNGARQLQTVRAFLTYLEHGPGSTELTY